MRVFRSLESARGHFERPVVTLGNFDGVHRGHQVILRELRDDADQRSVAAVVLTFEPHPIAVMRPDAAPKLLMPLGERLTALAEHGPDATVVQRFSKEFAAVAADDFVHEYIVDALDAQKILVGHDINFGRGRTGSADSLVEAGARYGFAVEVIRPVDVDGIVVHSSVVRRAVADGDMKLAARLLGRPHAVRGRVVSGAGRGTGLGFATANVRARTELVPPHGVYATVAVLDGREVDSVTSIGRNPTFDGTETVIEAHLFGSFDELYGKNVTLRFVDRVRDQKKFESPEALAAQIARDVTETKRILQEYRQS